MIMDFKPDKLHEWGPNARCDTIHFPGCFIRVKDDRKKCFLYKTKKHGPMKIFGPFDHLNDKNRRFKALITALQDDELNRKNLAKLVALRLQNAS